jgi:hypothetical protein
MTEADIRRIVEEVMAEALRPLFLAIRQGHRQADAQIEKYFELDKK